MFWLPSLYVLVASTLATYGCEIAVNIANMANERYAAQIEEPSGVRSPQLVEPAAAVT